MKITIFGAGYVGLVTGACFAELGNHVMCVDVNAERIAQLNNGVCPIHEPGLTDMIQKNAQAGRLTFTTDAKLGVFHGLYQFIAVGTPSDEDGSADLQYVLAVAETIGRYMTDYRMVINKSTVPVGTADKVKLAIKQHTKISFDVISNPEFLREGAAIDDFMGSDRIILGTETSEAAVKMRELYAPFDRNHGRVICMDVHSAELSKYAANAFLATKISFINEMSQLAERVGADIEQVRVGIGSDPRIGYHFINPGCGYGGSCFPKDVIALQHTADSVGYNVQLVKAVHEVNSRQKQILFEKISAHFSGNLAGKTIALWGLSFKPNTDDMREAASRVLMESLWKVGAMVQAYDPVAMAEAARLYDNHPQLRLMPKLEDALHGADALVVVTEWNEFLSPDFNFIKKTLKNPVIFDGRNLYDPVYMQSQGFDYYAIGRGKTA
ncbi:MAG: UDP-glucose dehydrogenase family protein [Gammaproteobacteria bacterium]